MKIFTRTVIHEGITTRCVVIVDGDDTITMVARKPPFAEMFADVLVNLVQAFTVTEVDRVH